MVLGAVGAGCRFIDRVSVSSTEAQASFVSQDPSISADGRFVAFVSEARNLVPGDTNGTQDVFVRDVLSGETTRVSVDSDEHQANFVNWAPSISADGRFVAFHSSASDLVPGDTNNYWDVFVRDRVAGTTVRASVSTTGVQSDGLSVDASISADGRFVAFTSWAMNLVPDDTTNGGDVFVRDLVASTTTRVSISSSGVEGDLFSYSPSISSDGRLIAFTSLASNLVPGDSPEAEDVYVRDQQAGTTTKVSVTGVGGQANADSRFPSISGDGQFVAFQSGASDLVPGDTNGAWDVFVRDLGAASTSRASIGTGGTEPNSISGDASISGDGRFVAFSSYATNLGAADTNGVFDVFLRDRANGTTTRVSTDTDGLQARNTSWTPSISGDGRYIAFLSIAPNLVAGDTNGTWDIFVTRSVRPEITSVTPGTGRRGAMVTVTLHGSGFVPGMGAVAARGVSVVSVTTRSETVAELELSIAGDAQLGAGPLTVFDPGTLGLATGSAGQCTGCFTVSGT